MRSNYKRMIEKMLEKDKRRRKRSPADSWVLYILKCKDGTFYTGIAKDLEKRLKTHNDGKGAKYTRTRLPVSLLYQEPCQSRAQALVRECAVKALPRIKKEALVYRRKTASPGRRVTEGSSRKIEQAAIVS